MPLDHNPGQLYVTCPAYYITCLREMFPPQAFTRISAGQGFAVQHIRDLFNREQFPGSFDYNGSIPYAYILPKQKDPTRWRPVSSYARAPHRRTLKHVAHALNYIISLVPVHQHFNLASAFEATRAQPAVADVAAE